MRIFSNILLGNKITWDSGEGTRGQCWAFLWFCQGATIDGTRREFRPERGKYHPPEFHWLCLETTRTCRDPSPFWRCGYSCQHRTTRCDRWPPSKRWEIGFRADSANLLASSSLTATWRRFWCPKSSPKISTPCHLRGKSNRVSHHPVGKSFAHPLQ